MARGEGRSDVFLAAGVILLVVGRFAWAGGDGDLEPLFLAAMAMSVALCGAAVASSATLGGAVRAVLAAIAFFTFALDPSTGYDERNFAYGGWGTVFAAIAVARLGRRGAIDEARAAAPGQRTVAAVTWVTGVLLLVAAFTFIAVTLVVIWALSRGGGAS